MQLALQTLAAIALPNPRMTDAKATPGRWATGRAYEGIIPLCLQIQELQSTAHLKAERVRRLHRCEAVGIVTGVESNTIVRCLSQTK